MESLMIPVYGLVLGFVVIILQQLIIFWQQQKSKKVFHSNKTLIEKIRRETSILFLAERMEEFRSTVKYLENKIKRLE